MTVDEPTKSLARCRWPNQGHCSIGNVRSEVVMGEAHNFVDMQAEDLLTLIESAEKVFEQKIAAERAELEERRLKLEKLEARRAGKVQRGRPAAAKTRKANGGSAIKIQSQATNGAAEPTITA
jgi:hypothetical protein